MTKSEPSKTRLRVAHLNPRQANGFALAPDATRRQALAQELGIEALPRLDFSGNVRAIDGDAWAVEGQLSAHAVQPCVITLVPVGTDLGEKVRRVFSPHIALPESDEQEMPNDEVEPLGQFIDLEAIMVEELALALPQYPRAGNAALDTPTDERSEDTRKPFSGLGDLLKNKKN